jgi:hypothetical protein
MPIFLFWFKFATEARPYKVRNERKTFLSSSRQSRLSSERTLKRRAHDNDNNDNEDNDNDDGTMTAMIKAMTISKVSKMAAMIKHKATTRTTVTWLQRR